MLQTGVAPFMTDGVALNQKKAWDHFGNVSNSFWGFHGRMARLACELEGLEVRIFQFQGEP